MLVIKNLDKIYKGTDKDIKEVLTKEVSGDDN